MKSLFPGHALFMSTLMVIILTSCGRREDLSAECGSLAPCECYRENHRRIIDCSNKSLPSIPNFVDLVGKSFHSILLNDNRISVISRNAFQNLDIRLINLSNNPLQTVSDGAIMNSHAVQELYLKNCTLNLAPFSLEKLPNLTRLDMSYNDISSLHEKAFRNLKNLTYLNLSHNRRLQFPDPFRAFDNLRNLEYVDLSFCALYNFPLGRNRPIEHIRKLKTVLLQNNSIGAVPDDILIGAPELEVLDLDNNPVSLASDKVFHGLHRLLVLKLGTCDAPEIKKAIFKDLHGLETLTFHHCGVKKIEKDFFYDFYRLRVLDIGGNPSIQFTQDLISGLEGRLTKLGISDMNIKHFPKDILAQFSNLRVLNATGNSIRELREGDFTCFYQRNAEIHLDNNQISHISSRVSDGLRRPFTLSLKNNNLTTMSFLWEFPCLYARSVVDVQGNPVNCDCAIYSLVQQKNIKLQGSCQTPTQYRGIALVPPYGQTSKQMMYFESFMHKVCGKNGETRFEQRFDCGCNEWRPIHHTPCTLNSAPAATGRGAAVLLVFLLSLIGFLYY